MSENSNASTIEDPKSITPYELWSGEIAAAESALKKFWQRGGVANIKYLDDRDAGQTGMKLFNIFKTNTDILTSSLYAQLPKPSVSRRFTDYDDEVARVAALIIERSITQDLDDPTDNFDPTMRSAVQDRLIAGLSQAWLRLETDTEEISIPPTPGNDVDYGEDDSDDSTAPQLGPDGQPIPLPRKITDQRVCVDYIFWSDFLWSPCRVWEERRWVGRKAYMTREELIERFGDAKGKACPLDYNPTFKAGQDAKIVTPVDDILKKAVVYELWDRTTKKVFWFAKGMTELLDERADPLGLEGFDPCPRPMLANITTSNTVPRPDYYILQDQYTELNSINNRISNLVRACKVAGVYDKGSPGVVRLMQEGNDNLLIPVDNWSMFAEKGGIKGQIDWIPLEMIVQALRELNAAREVIKGQIYELTGIADIVRGASKASETLGAQEIKAQFASIRIKRLQDEVANFASDIMRIKAEIMVKHFDPEILIKKSNIAATGNDEWVPQALALLQSEEGFEWRIQVSSDTMAQADYTQEKQDRIDFMTAVTQFFQQVGPMLETAPESAPVMLGLLKWTVAGFRGARDIEGMLDKALDAIQKQPEQPKEPTPEEKKAAQEQQQAQQAHELEMAKQQAEAQRAEQSHQMEMQAQQQESQLEQQRLMMEQQAEQQRLAMELMFEKQSLMLEERGRQQQLIFEAAMNALKLSAAEKQTELKLEGQEAANEQKASAAKETT